MSSMYLGEQARLSLQLSDGRTDLFPRATIYNGSVVPVAAVDLVHTGLGLYRAAWTPGYAAAFDVVYRIFDDAAHTSLADYERTTEQIQVQIPEEHIQVNGVYDASTTSLRINAFLLRLGVVVPLPQLVSCVLEIYSDAAMIHSATINAPDAQGVFKASILNPNIETGKLYTVKAQIQTTTHLVVSERGFKVVT